MILDFIEKQKHEIETNDDLLIKIWMHIDQYTELVNDPSTKGIFDQCSHRELLIKGMMGTIYGASVMINKQIPRGQMIFIADSDQEDLIDPYDMSFLKSLFLNKLIKIDYLSI